MQTPEFLSRREFSKRLGISIATLDRLLKEKKIPFEQPGGLRHRVMIPIIALDVLRQIREKETTPTSSEKPVKSPDVLSGPTPRWRRKNESST